MLLPSIPPVTFWILTLTLVAGLLEGKVGGSFPFREEVQDEVSALQGSLVCQSSSQVDFCFAIPPPPPASSPPPFLVFFSARRLVFNRQYPFSSLVLSTYTIIPPTPTYTRLR
jgi:hypothetical protein